MKTIFIAAMIALAVSSCSKKNSEGTQQITGQWEHRKDIGGIMALIEYPAGNGNIQVFGSNNELKILHGGAVAYTGTYSIYPSGRRDKWLLTLKYLQNAQMQTVTDTVMFQANQLIYLRREACCDMQERYYERVSDHP